tara:strand:+ start:273 stop:446 length:174 start_codon:yes stop_codon:yes gene_type:complete
LTTNLNRNDQNNTKTLSNRFAIVTSRIIPVRFSSELHFGQKFEPAPYTPFELLALPV